MTAILRTLPCGCRIVRCDEGRDVDIKYCNLHAAAGEMREALDTIAHSACCETPGCSVEWPMCDAMTARAALASARGEAQ